VLSVLISARFVGRARPSPDVTRAYPYFLKSVESFLLRQIDIFLSDRRFFGFHPVPMGEFDPLFSRLSSFFSGGVVFAGVVRYIVYRLFPPVSIDLCDIT